MLGQAIPSDYLNLSLNHHISHFTFLYFLYLFHIIMETINKVHWLLPDILLMKKIQLSDKLIVREKNKHPPNLE